MNGILSVEGNAKSANIDKKICKIYLLKKIYNYAKIISHKACCRLST